MAVRSLSRSRKDRRPKRTPDSSDERLGRRLPAQHLRTSPSLTPDWLNPMLATLADKAFSSKDWIFEPKLDGERCLAFCKKGRVSLFSRSRQPLNETYPELVDSLEKQTAADFIIDGEVIAFEPHSTRTSFSRLQRRMHIHSAAVARASDVPVFYYVFDILYLDGHDVRGLPLMKRKEILQAAIHIKDPLRYNTHLEKDGIKFYTEACRQGWEGLVAKRSDSLYVSGRSRDWLKLKCVNEQEFVIGGYSDPEGARNHFGALLLGYYEEGVLRFAGKVGTGYDEQTLQLVSQQMTGLEQTVCPFFKIDISRRGLHWVKPVLVAQIGFSEWTDEGKLRHPRFLGLRPDKSAKEVTRERRIPLESLQ